MSAKSPNRDQPTVIALGSMHTVKPYQYAYKSEYKQQNVSAMNKLTTFHLTCEYLSSNVDTSTPLGYPQTQSNLEVQDHVFQNIFGFPIHIPHV